MAEPPETLPEGAETPPDLPPHLRRLQRLVTVLMWAMIAGVLTISATLVIRLNTDRAPVVIAPGDFTLPTGVGLTGFSVVGGRTVIVGDDGVIRVFDSESRALVQEFTLAD